MMIRSDRSESLDLFTKDRLIPEFTPTDRHILREMRIENALVNRRGDSRFLVIVYSSRAEGVSGAFSLHGERYFSEFTKRFGVPSIECLQGKMILEVLFQVDSYFDVVRSEGIIPKP